MEPVTWLDNLDTNLPQNSKIICQSWSKLTIGKWSVRSQRVCKKGLERGVLRRMCLEFALWWMVVAVMNVSWEISVRQRWSMINEHKLTTITNIDSNSGGRSNSQGKSRGSTSFDNQWIKDEQILRKPEMLLGFLAICRSHYGQLIRTWHAVGTHIDDPNLHNRSC